MTFHMNGTSGQARGQGRLDAPEDLLRAMVQQLVQETIQSEFEEDIRDLFTSDPARMVEGQAHEGVWVLVLWQARRLDALIGIGVLDNPVLSLSGEQPSLGEVVEFRQLHPDHKPYITGWWSRKSGA